MTKSYENRLIMCDWLCKGHLSDNVVPGNEIVAFSHLTPLTRHFWKCGTPKNSRL